MRFSEIKKFSGSSLTDVLRYLPVLVQGVRDLFTGLQRLDFSENFQSFEWSGTIAAGAEAHIPNAFETMPRRWFITDATGGNQIIRGPTAWSVNTLHLKNAGAAAATVTVTFFK